MSVHRKGSEQDTKHMSQLPYNTGRFKGELNPENNMA